MRGGGNQRTLSFVCISMLDMYTKACQLKHIALTIFQCLEPQWLALWTPAEGVGRECEGVVVVGKEGGDHDGCVGSEEGEIFSVSDGAVQHEDELVSAYHSIPVFHWWGFPGDVDLSVPDIQDGYGCGRS